MLRRLLFATFATLLLTAVMAASPAAAQEAPPPPPPTLRPGDTGPDVQDMEQRLKNSAYDPGPIDGKFDQATLSALWAFKKSQGMPVSSEYSPDVRERLYNNVQPPPPLNMGSEPDRVEIHLFLQLMTVYRNGGIALISHISTGNNKRYCVKGKCGVAITPRGAWRLQRSIAGWRTGRLGRMYNPQYFTNSGHAIHGSQSVPLSPASHGCVRIPMHTARWFPNLVFKGIPIYIGG